MVSGVVLGTQTHDTDICRCERGPTEVGIEAMLACSCGLGSAATPTFIR